MLNYEKSFLLPSEKPMSEEKVIPQPLADDKLKELQHLLNQVDEHGDFVELTEDQEKAVTEKWQELAKKIGSWGSAVKKKEAEVLDFLITVGARQDESSRVSYHEKEKRKEMLDQLMFYAIGESSVDVLKVLMKHAPRYGTELDLESRFPMQKPGSDPNRPDLRHVSAPFYAAENNNWEVLSWLIQEGRVSMDVRGNNDETLFMAAVCNNQFELADRLLSISPSREETLNAITTLYRQSAFHSVAQVGNEEALAYLIARRADPTLESENGHLASEYLPEEPEYVKHFDIMEDYRDAYTANQPFAPPGEWYLDHEGNEPAWMKEDLSVAEEPARRSTMAM